MSADPPEPARSGDLTRGPELRAVLGFALPLTAANLLQQGYLLADSLIVGRFAGGHGLAVIGAAQPFSYLICMIFVGLATGVTVRVARLRGAGDPAPLGPSVLALSVLTLAWSAVSVLVVAGAARPLLVLAGVPAGLAADTRSFLLVLCLGLPALLGTIGLNCWLRGAGVVRAAVTFLIVGSAVNVVLAGLFVGVWGLGLTGAALATVAANTVALAVGVAGVRRSRLVTITVRKDAGTVPAELRAALRLGVPLALQHLAVALGAGLLIAAISPLGEDLLAGATVVNRIEVFTAMLFADLGGALTAFAAQNQAAGAGSRIRSAFARTAAVTVAATTVLSGLMVAAAPAVAAAFVPDPAVQLVAVRYLVITYPFFVLFTLTLVAQGHLTGLGRTVFPLVCTLISFGVVRLSLSYLWRGPFGVDGVIWAVVAGWAAGAALTGWAVVREHRRHSSRVPLFSSGSRP